MIPGIELGHDWFPGLAHETIYRYRTGEIAAIITASFRGDATHRTWNLEIPGLVLRTIPE